MPGASIPILVGGTKCRRERKHRHHNIFSPPPLRGAPSSEGAKWSHKQKFLILNEKRGCDLICPLSSRQVKYLKNNYDYRIFGCGSFSFMNSYAVTPILIALILVENPFFQLSHPFFFVFLDSFVFCDWVSCWFIRC